jgi:hypothetical protein
MLAVQRYTSSVLAPEAELLASAEPVGASAAGNTAESACLSHSPWQGTLQLCNVACRAAESRVAAKH